MKANGTLFFFCGKMGAGKTTKSKQVACDQNAVLISEDEWLESLYPVRIIREVRESDLENIEKIVSAAIRECVADSDELHRFLTDEVCQSFVWWKSNKEQSLHLLCEEKGVVLGVILVKEYWNLSSLFVDPALHGTGVGRELINEAIAICSTKSPKGCLKLNSSNYAAPFYKKVGFTQTGEGIERPGGCVPFEYNF